MKKRVLSAFLTAGILGLGAASAAMAQAVIQRDAGIVTPADFYGPGEPQFGDPDTEVKLVRNGNGLSLRGTAIVTPNHAHTVWWIILFGPDLVVLNATGGISNAAGEFHFAAGLPVGTYVTGDEVPRLVFIGGEFDEPLTAPVLLHILDHGPPTPGLIPDQISDIFTGPPGYCHPVFGCPLATEIFIPSP